MQHHDFTQEENARHACARQHAWQVLCMQAAVRAGFRCQICNERGMLLFHARSFAHEDVELGDVLACCSECHALAEVCKQIKQKKSLLLRLVLEALLFLMAALVVIAFWSLSPALILGLFLAGGFFALLLEVVFTYTKPEP